MLIGDAIYLQFQLGTIRLDIKIYKFELGLKISKL